MQYNNNVIRSFAKSKTRGNITLIPICYLIIFTIFFAINYPFITLYYDSPTLKNDLLSFAITLLSQCLFSVASCGIILISLNTIRDKSASVKDILFPFKKHTDRYLISIIIVLILTQIPMIPNIYLSYAYTTLELSKHADLQLYYVLSYGIGMLISYVIAIIFQLSSYLLVDNSDLHPIEALKKSHQLMKGHKWRFFLLNLSFLGHILLSIITFFILFPRTLTYITYARAYFYCDIIGELQEDLPTTDRNLDVFA